MFQTQTSEQKTQNQLPLGFVWKILSTQLAIIKILACFLLLGFGITLGFILCFYIKYLPFNLHVTQLSLSFPQNSSPPPSPPLPPSSPPPPPPINKTRIGLVPFIKVPPAMHDMNEGELLWRASMSPKVREFPYRRVPKVAFLFLTRGPVPMAAFWEIFFRGNDGLYSVYIHSNPSYNDTEDFSPESPFYGRRIPSKTVQWGEVNMIEAERRLLANALLDFSNQRFVLLSETCIPLFNFSTIYSYLINSTQTFVEAYDLPGTVGRGRYNSKMEPIITLAQWRKGSQWFEMDRELAVEIVSDQKFLRVFQRFCRSACYSDEHYLPTLVSIKFWERNSNRSLTRTDWSKGGPHPAVYHRMQVTVEFLKWMRSGGGKCLYNGRITDVCFLFARKFSQDSLVRLLRFAPAVMHFNR